MVKGSGASLWTLSLHWVSYNKTGLYGRNSSFRECFSRKLLEFPKLRKFPISNPPEEHSLKLDFFLRCYGGGAGPSQGLRLGGEEEVSHRDMIFAISLV